MKKQLILLFILFFTAGGSLMAQTSGFSYQAVIRDAMGKPSVNQIVNLRFRILSSANQPDNVPAYTENITLITNQFGMVDTVIGKGDPSKFDTIQWNAGKRYLQVAMLGVTGMYQPLGEAKEIVHPPFAGGEELWHIQGDTLLVADKQVHINQRTYIRDNREETDPVLKIFKHSDIAYPNKVLFEIEGGVTDQRPKKFQVYTGNDNPWILKAVLDGQVRMRDDRDNYDPVLKISKHSDFEFPNKVIFEVEGGVTDSSPRKFRIFTDNGDPYTLKASFDGNFRVNGHFSVDGSAEAKCLTIVGGCDITEPFPNAQNETLTPGSVVVIDENNPGMIRLATSAYDTKVAGVISGAGDVKPGLSLSQAGVLDNGQQMALAGRVYVRVSASNGAIRPGDMLTTSDLPGIAMKASDPTRSYGTVLGKAMSGLESGEGLVLVLVGLQ